MEQLGHAILLSWVGVAVLLLLVDRFLASIVNYRILVGVEIILLLAVVAIHQYQNRTIYVSAYSEMTHFGVASGVCDAAASELAGTFGFDKIIVLDDDGQHVLSALRQRFNHVGWPAALNFTRIDIQGWELGDREA